MPYTYAILEVSQSTYDEIAGKLRNAGQDQAFFHQDDSSLNGIVIDMHGIALALADEPTPTEDDECSEKDT